MKINLLKALGILAAAFVISSCQKPGASNVTISVIPNNNVSLVPGASSTCTDLVAYKAAFGATPVAFSAAAYSFLFQQFQLVWNSPDVLYVSTITVTMDSPMLTSTPYTCTLTGTDVQNLLATTTGAIPGGSPTTITSNDTSRTATVFAPCGLACGGVAVRDPHQSFTASMRIELQGYSVGTDGSETAQKTHITTHLQYSGGQ
jgi:hypothetical protein